MKDVLRHRQGSGSGLTHLSNCCLVPKAAAQQALLAAVERRGGAQLLRCPAEPRHSRWVLHRWLTARASLQ